MKPLFTILGSICVLLGAIGIVIPGLPTTPFLLLGAGCYVRGSNRLYNALLESPVFGKRVKSFREKGGLSVYEKLSAVIIMWLMIGMSTLFFIKSTAPKLAVGVVGIIGSFVMLFVVKTYRKEKSL